MHGRGANEDFRYCPMLSLRGHVQCAIISVSMRLPMVEFWLLMVLGCFTPCRGRNVRHQPLGRISADADLAPTTATISKQHFLSTLPTHLSRNIYTISSRPIQTMPISQSSSKAETPIADWLQMSNLARFTYPASAVLVRRCQGSGMNPTSHRRVKGQTSRCCGRHFGAEEEGGRALGSSLLHHPLLSLLLRLWLLGFC